MSIRDNIFAWTSVFLGTCALFFLSLAISSNNWLLTTERKLLEEFLQESCLHGEGTRSFSNVSLLIRAEFGLWRFCTIFDGSEPQCVYLDYTAGLIAIKEDCQETTAAIAETQKGSAPAFLLSLILILMAVILNIIGNCTSKALVQAAGTLYLTTGLCLLVGGVLYITFVNDEVHYAKPTTDVYFFEYTYGWGIYTLSAAFIVTNMACVMCVTATKNYYLANVMLTDKLIEDHTVPKTIPKTSYDTLIL